jgi:predicted permease
MNWISQLRRRRQMREDLREEIREHIHERVDALMAEGVPPQEAERRARVAFGSPDLVQERGDEVWIWTALSAWARDAQFALRQMRKSPGFAITTTLTLALGIGANLAIFNILDALLLESLPVHDPDSLVAIAARAPASAAFGLSDAPINLNLPIIEQIRLRARSFEGVLGWTSYDVVLQENGSAPRKFPGAIVSGNAFSVLGLHPAAGRLLDAEDDKPGGGAGGWAAVLSYGFWTEHYAGSLSVIGKRVRLSDQSVTIVGVAPRGFDSVQVDNHPVFYLPLEFDTAVRGKDSMLHTAASMWLTTLARLKPGVDHKEAAAEMDALWPGILDATIPPKARHVPFIEKLRASVAPGRTGWSYLRLAYARPLMILQGMVALLFLLCCANLAGLCVARATARRQEFAIRGALGAARGRLLRQVLAENIALAIPGALLSLLFAWQAIRVLTPMFSRGNMRLAVHFNPWLFAGAIVAGMLAAVLFGILPAWFAARFAPIQATSSAARMLVPGRIVGRTARWLFVPFQLAVSLTLVIAAGLLSATLMHLYRDNVGFQTEGIYLADANFSKLALTPERQLELDRRMVQRLAQMPGVMTASFAANTPLNGSISSDDFVPVTPGQQTPKPIGTFTNEVGPHYFEAFGTPMVEGRDFNGTSADASSCIVNVAAAQTLFAKTDPLGHLLRVFQRQVNGDNTQHDCQVIGVVANAKYDTLWEQPPATVYKPFAADGNPGTEITLVMRARSLMEARSAFNTSMDELSSTTPREEVIPFRQQVDASLQRERMMSTLSGFFAVISLLLSAVGIFGVMGWTVTQRTAEIGVRMALGATRPHILRGFLKQAVWFSVAGLGAGLIAAWVAAGALRSLLYGVDRMDPLVLAGSVAVLAATVITAAYFPARRAASTDPMNALRQE